jgi:hypothetical protein
MELVKRLYLRMGCRARLERQWYLLHISQTRRNIITKTDVIKLLLECDKFRMSLDLCDVNQYYKT